MTTPHKHAELIKAWADGAKIEYKTRGDHWSIAPTPSWCPDLEYRIKPEPKPNVVSYGWADNGRWMSFGETKQRNHNLKLTFCGETRKLLGAEVI